MTYNPTLEEVKGQISSLIDKINSFQPIERKEALEFMRHCVKKNLDEIEKLIEIDKPYNSANSNKSNKSDSSSISEDVKVKTNVSSKIYKNPSTVLKAKHRKTRKVIRLMPIFENTKTRKKRIRSLLKIKHFDDSTLRKVIKKRYNYECEHCHIKLRSKINIDRHKKNLCSVLNKKSKDTNVIEEETNSGSGLELKCDKCNHIFLRKQQYNMHMKHHNKYKCTDCPLTFASQKLAMKHKQETILSGDKATKMHYIQGLENMEIKCLLCPRTFLRVKKLKEHMQAHAVGCLLSCPICNASYRNKKVYELHMQKSGHHEVTKQSNKEVDDKENTSKISISTNSLEDVNLVCDICGKTFSKKANLCQHKKRTHSQVRFSCEICDFSSMSRSNLRRHIQSHTSERHVVCDKCGVSFRNASALKEHTLYVHQERCQYQCEDCPKKFKVKSALSRHVRSCHSNERPYACKLCKQAYKRSSHLRRHHIQRHPEIQAIEYTQTQEGNIPETTNQHEFEKFDHNVYMDIEWNTNIQNTQSEKQNEQHSMLNLMTADAVELITISSKNEAMKQLVSDINTEFIESDGMTYQALWSDKEHTMNMDNTNNVVKYNADHEALPKSYIDKFVTTMELTVASHGSVINQYMGNTDNHKLTDISNTFSENAVMNGIGTHIDQVMEQDLQQTFSSNEGCDNGLLLDHSSLQCGLNVDICKNVNTEQSDSLSVLSSLSDYIQTPFQYI